MNRRALFGIGGTALLPLPALAQDGTVPPEWEERFAALEERVTAIEQRLDALTSDDAPEPTKLAEQQDQTASSGIMRLSGSGTTMTELVSMEAGLYRVEATVTIDTGYGDAFMVQVAGSNDWQDSIFIEFLEGDGIHEVSTNWTARQNGDYAFQIDCMSEWELTFEAM